MSLQLYCFDVDQGQCIGLRLPNGQWDIFDSGTKEIGDLEFSPVEIIAGMETKKKSKYLLSSFLDGTYALPIFREIIISHYHGDHMTGFKQALRYAPEYVTTVVADREYIEDVRSSSSPYSFAEIMSSCEQRIRTYNRNVVVPQNGTVNILNTCIPVSEARRLGGDSNERVNNSSIVTRIDYGGQTILICGDMMCSGWNHVLNTSLYWPFWRRMVSNVDIMIAPHHGHQSSFSSQLMSLAKPKAVIISARGKDKDVSTSYSSDYYVEGLSFNGQIRRCFSTRDAGNIVVEFSDEWKKLGFHSFWGSFKWN